MDRAEILAWRKARRAELIAARSALPQAEHRAASGEIHHRLVALLSPFPRSLIGAYWPFRREFNVRPLLEWLIGRRHEIALPVVVGRGLPLEFRRWTQDTQLASGVWDIPYPAEGKPVWPSVLIIPMVGFDQAGYRLGYGGGFYDRTLASYGTKPSCIGVVFELGRLETIFPLPHDVPMDYVVSEAGLYRRRPEGLAML